MSRQDYNRIILEILKQEVEKYPDLRFGQILTNLSIITHSESPSSFTNDGLPNYIIDDPFYEESKDTLERVYKNKFLIIKYN